MRKHSKDTNNSASTQKQNKTKRNETTNKKKMDSLVYMVGIIITLQNVSRTMDDIFREKWKITIVQLRICLSFFLLCRRVGVHVSLALALSLILIFLLFRMLQMRKQTSERVCMCECYMRRQKGRRHSDNRSTHCPETIILYMAYSVYKLELLQCSFEVFSGSACFLFLSFYFLILNLNVCLPVKYICMNAFTLLLMPSSFRGSNLSSTNYFMLNFFISRSHFFLLSCSSY